MYSGVPGKTDLVIHMLSTLWQSQAISLYRINSDSDVISLIASTPETRAICNDPAVMGIEYTHLLQKAAVAILKKMQSLAITTLKEHEAIVFNVLRGGLNFGLREALAEAFGWNEHGSAFISAQRARISPDASQWHITESDYKKVYLPDEATIVLGDVVATGTSLQHALDILVGEVEAQQTTLKSIVFFTIGGKRSEEIIKKLDVLCRQKFPDYRQSVVIYLEGRFAVASKQTDLDIKIDGTDLLRTEESLMAPEFIESQYENPAYPLERCTIYDAGSRAFWLPEYKSDVKEYWQQMLELAKNGRSFEQELKKRCNCLDQKRFKAVDLASLCQAQIEKF
ncbi:MAG: hypothetical protein ACO2ZM_05065 [Francisellaceae bacterium]